MLEWSENIFFFFDNHINLPNMQILYLFYLTIKNLIKIYISKNNKTQWQFAPLLECVGNFSKSHRVTYFLIIFTSIVFRKNCHTYTNTHISLYMPRTTLSVHSSYRPNVTDNKIKLIIIIMTSFRRASAF